MRCPAGADPDSQPGEQHSNLRVSDCRCASLASLTTARSDSDFKMQRFESCRLELRVLAIPILECRCSNPAASTGQSVSNAYGIGSRSQRFLDGSGDTGGC